MLIGSIEGVQKAYDEWHEEIKTYLKTGQRGWTLTEEKEGYVNLVSGAPSLSFAQLHSLAVFGKTAGATKVFNESTEIAKVDELNKEGVRPSELGTTNAYRQIKNILNTENFIKAAKDVFGDKKLKELFNEATRVQAIRYINEEGEVVDNTVAVNKDGSITTVAANINKGMNYKETGAILKGAGGTILKNDAHAEQFNKDIQILASLNEYLFPLTAFSSFMKKRFKSRKNKKIKKINKERNKKNLERKKINNRKKRVAELAKHTGFTVDELKNMTDKEILLLEKELREKREEIKKAKINEELKILDKQREDLLEERAKLEKERSDLFKTLSKASPEEAKKIKKELASISNKIKPFQETLVDLNLQKKEVIEKGLKLMEELNAIAGITASRNYSTEFKQQTKTLISLKEKLKKEQELLKSKSKDSKDLSKSRKNVEKLQEKIQNTYNQLQELEGKKNTGRQAELQEKKKNLKQEIETTKRKLRVTNVNEAIAALRPKRDVNSRKALEKLEDLKRLEAEVKDIDDISKEVAKKGVDKASHATEEKTINDTSKTFEDKIKELNEQIRSTEDLKEKASLIKERRDLTSLLAKTVESSVSKMEDLLDKNAIKAIENDAKLKGMTAPSTKIREKRVKMEQRINNNKQQILRNTDKKLKPLISEETKKIKSILKELKLDKNANVSRTISSTERAIATMSSLLTNPDINSKTKRAIKRSIKVLNKRKASLDKLLKHEKALEELKNDVKAKNINEIEKEKANLEKIIRNQKAIYAKNKEDIKGQNIDIEKTKKELQETNEKVNTLETAKNNTERLLNDKNLSEEAKATLKRNLDHIEKDLNETKSLKKELNEKQRLIDKMDQVKKYEEMTQKIHELNREQELIHKENKIHTIDEAKAEIKLENKKIKSAIKGKLETYTKQEKRLLDYIKKGGHGAVTGIKKTLSVSAKLGATGGFVLATIAAEKSENRNIRALAHTADNIAEAVIGGLKLTTNTAVGAIKIGIAKQLNDQKEVNRVVSNIEKLREKTWEEIKDSVQETLDDYKYGKNKEFHSLDDFVDDAKQASETTYNETKEAFDSASTIISLYTKLAHKRNNGTITKEEEEILNKLEESGVNKGNEVIKGFVGEV